RSSPAGHGGSWCLRSLLGPWLALKFATKPYRRSAMTTAVDKWPASARLLAVATAGHLPTALTPLPGARPNQMHRSRTARGTGLVADHLGNRLLRAHAGLLDDADGGRQAYCPARKKLAIRKLLLVTGDQRLR